MRLALAAAILLTPTAPADLQQLAEKHAADYGAKIGELRENIDAYAKSESASRSVPLWAGYYGSGLNLQINGRSDAAAYAFARALAENPSNGRIANSLGYSLIRDGNLAAAETVLAETVRIAPELAPA